MRKYCFLMITVVFTLFGLCTAVTGAEPVRIGSKKFTENVILGEITSLFLQGKGIPSTHYKQLGGTRVLWNALKNGDIDVYPEYTGTITHEILQEKGLSDMNAIRNALLRKGIQMSGALGFNNTYAMGMKREIARGLGISRISDLRNFPGIKFGFTNEFMNREDGWPYLQKHYQLPQVDVRGLDHDLAFRGIDSDSVQVIDIYSTDAEIAYYDLITLEDDLHIFPKYNAVLIYRKDLTERCPGAVDVISKLEGHISEKKMRAMNVLAKIKKIPEGKVAANFLAEEFHVYPEVHVDTPGKQILQRTGEHLFLVTISLMGGIMISVPLGIVAAKISKLDNVILSIIGIIQTIPALALLVFMIPLFGIGTLPALFALFLYSLLPVVRNTYTGLCNIPPDVKETACALGLPPMARLFRVELPLASRSILAGIKTSAVMNVGFATLGALIGSGGYGQSILTGIRLDDMGLILQGAIPAAVLAILIQGLFDLAERFFVSKGLRIKTG